MCVCKINRRTRDTPKVMTGDVENSHERANALDVIAFERGRGGRRQKNPAMDPNGVDGYFITGRDWRGGIESCGIELRALRGISP